MIRTIGAAVSIGLVVLLVVSAEIVKAEPVMCSDQANALIGTIHVVRTVGEKIVAAIEASHERTDFTGIAFDEASQIVAKFSVPLAPHQPWITPTEHVSTDVPSLCNKPQVPLRPQIADLADHGRLTCLDVTEVVAGEDGREIKSEPIDPHFLCPMSEAAQDQGADHGMRTAGGISAPGVIAIAAVGVQ